MTIAAWHCMSVKGNKSAGIESIVWENLHQTELYCNLSEWKCSSYVKLFMIYSQGVCKHIYPVQETNNCCCKRTCCWARRLHLAPLWCYLGYWEGLVSNPLCHLWADTRWVFFCNIPSHHGGCFGEYVCTFPEMLYCLINSPSFSFTWCVYINVTLLYE